MAYYFKSKHMVLLPEGSGGGDAVATFAALRTAKDNF